MITINENYLKLEQNYLFSKIGKKVEEFQLKYPSKNLIKLGIGDITRPIPRTILEAIHKAIDEQSSISGLKGYGPEQGYGFLRKVIVKNEYSKFDIQEDEIFISDGAKCDTGNIVEIFSKENVVGIMNPVYPVYEDTNKMSGKENIVYLIANENNEFKPDIPKEKIDIIYLCFPNNPTGTVLNRQELTMWVEYAIKNKCIILFDAAYEAFIEGDEIPHSIYEIDGAKQVAIEFKSFSKTAGFTGLRCSYTVIPKQVIGYTSEGIKIQIHNLWKRRQSTKFNGTPYIIQRAAEAVYTEQGQKEIKENIEYYKENAKIIREGLINKGYKVIGGKHAPYIWVKVPKKYTSWDFFDILLEKYGIIGTPGVGFGEYGEGYFRLTAFGSRQDTIEAIKKIDEQEKV